MADPRLQVRDLWYEEKGQTVLHEVNLTIPAGESMGLHDQTGLSYAPLLQICATLLEPSRGEMRVDGIPVPFGDEAALSGLRRKIAYVVSDAALISNLTLLQNVSLGWAYHEKKPLDDVWQEGFEMLAYFQIEGQKDLRPTDVSAEVVKRAICARELAKKPVLVLLDAFVETLSGEGQGLFTSYVDKWMKETGSCLLVASTGTAFIGEYASLITQSHILANGTIIYTAT